MLDKRIRVERRKNRRYKAVEGAYAVIKPSLDKMGPIVDISMGGLCFKYTDPGNAEAGNQGIWDEKINLSSLGYHVRDISFKIISDEEVASVPSFQSGAAKIKKKQIQFVGLDFEQMVDLDHYLQNNIPESDRLR